MTTGTKLTEDDARQILRGYNLRLRGLGRIWRGTINSNYWVQTDAGPAFLRINEGKTEDDVRFEADLIWHLGSRGVATPQLWRTRASEPYLLWRPSRHAAALPVMLMTWVAGLELTEDDLTEAHTHAVGVLLGQLHLGTAGFPHSRPGIYTLARIQDRLRRMQRDPRAVADVGPLLAELGQEASDLRTARQRDLPSGVGHSDLFPDNLLFSRKRLTGAERPDGKDRPGQLGWILDLEQAATIPYVYDVAVALLAFCAPPAVAGATADEAIGPLHRARARALLAGYQTMRVLGEVEWRALPAELRWAALRFTTTRLTDIEHYGQPRLPALTSPPATAEPPSAGAAPPELPRAHRRGLRPPTASTAPAQPKDYRDFARRLALLRPLGLDELQKSLR